MKTHFVYLSKFSRKDKNTGERKKFANYVELDRQIIEKMLEAIAETWNQGFGATNRLEGEAWNWWDKNSIEWGIHRNNPYKGEYYSNTALDIAQSAVHHFYLSLPEPERLEVFTRYEHGGYSSGYGVPISAQGTARAGQCCFDNSPLFPPITDYLPNNAFSVEIIEAGGVEVRPSLLEGEIVTFYFQNGKGLVNFSSYTDPKDVEIYRYNQEFWERFGSK